jgi:hypothetical protein
MPNMLQSNMTVLLPQERIIYFDVPLDGPGTRSPPFCMRPSSFVLATIEWMAIRALLDCLVRSAA